MEMITLNGQALKSTNQFVSLIPVL